MQIKPKTDKTAAIKPLATGVFAPVCILSLMATNTGAIAESKYRIWKLASCQKTTGPDSRIINKYTQKKIHDNHAIPRAFISASNNFCILVSISCHWRSTASRWYGINEERNMYIMENVRTSASDNI
ncbi:hypothetical protein ACWKX9_26030 [Enterobacter asburiae]